MMGSLHQNMMDGVRSRRSLGTAFFLLSLPMLLALSAGAGSRRDEAATVQKPVVKTGDVRRFRLTLNIHAHTPMGEQTIKVAETVNSTVKEAMADGSFTVVYQFDTGRATIGEREVDVLALLPIVTITRSAEGKYSARTEGGNPEGNAEVAGVMQQLTANAENLFPAKPVKPGDRWKLAFANANALIGSAKLQGEAQLSGKEKIQNGETLHVKFTADGDEKEPGEKTHTEGVFDVNPVSGEIVKFSHKGNGRFAGGKADVELIVSALGKDPKDDPKE